MKKTLLVIFIALSLSTTAQLYSLTDSCSVIIINNLTSRILQTYPKSALWADTTAGLLRLKLVSNNTVLASWTPSQITSLPAFSIQKGYQIINAMLGYTCVHSSGGCSGTTGATGPTGPTGASITSPPDTLHIAVGSYLPVVDALFGIRGQAIIGDTSTWQYINGLVTVTGSYRMAQDTTLGHYQSGFLMQLPFPGIFANGNELNGQAIDTIGHVAGIGSILFGGFYAAYFRGVCVLNTDTNTYHFTYTYVTDTTIVGQLVNVGPTGATGPTGSGGGSTPDLGSVTAVGNVTDEDIVVQGVSINGTDGAGSGSIGALQFDTAGEIFGTNYTGSFLMWNLNSNGTLNYQDGYNNINGWTIDPTNLTRNRTFVLPDTSFFNGLPPFHKAYLTTSVNGVSANRQGDISLSATNIGAWGLTGNPGTNPSANYIGTSDATQLNIGVDGAYNIQMAPYIASTQNFAYQINDGASQLFSATSNNPSSDNTSVTIGDVQGYWNETLISINDPSQTIYLNAPNITMGGNTQIGSASYVWPNSNSSGSLTNDGSGNLSWGYQTLDQTLSAGNMSAQSATVGQLTSSNDFLLGGSGYHIGMGAYTDPSNMAHGYGVLSSNVSGLNNTAIGYQALTANISGSNNAAIGGQYVLVSNTTGSGNFASGQYCMLHNTSGSSNVAIGPNALSGDTTGSGDIALGSYAMSSGNNTNCIALGGGSMSNATGATDVIALGVNAAANTQTMLIAIGKYAGINNITGYNNGFVGYGAGGGNTSGHSNTAFGDYSLNTSQTGNNNTSVGVLSMNAGNGMNNCTGIGENALAGVTSGADNNTGVGAGAGSSVTTGSGNTFLGYNANVTYGSGTLTNVTVIGANVTGNASNTTYIGGNNIVTDVALRNYASPTAAQADGTLAVKSLYVLNASATLPLVQGMVFQKY